MKLRPSVVVPLLGTFTLLLVIVMSLVVIGISDNEGDSGDGSSPTPPAVAGNQTATPRQTGTQRGTPTPLSTAVSRFTPTPLRFATSVVPATQIAQVPPINQPQQTAIALTSPTTGSILKGYVTILGSASHPNFVQYALEYGPNPNSANLWYPITTVPITRTVVNNALGAWNTTTVPDGSYQIRLHVWLSGGEDFRTVTNLTVQNTGQRPPTGQNNNPLLSPIGPISITQGNALTIALGMTDVDNDPLTYVAQVANPSIATVTPSGASAITISGLKAGSTNVNITINDGRGGTASTSFSVTVNAPVAQNNPPAISPIPAQTLTTGQNLNIAIAVSDPDSGDTVSVTTSSTAANLATAVISGNTLTISAKAQGSAGINVTATDSRGLSSTVSFTVTVTNPVQQNQAPTISPPGNQTVNTAATVDVNLSITDPNNDPLTLTAASSNNGIASVVIVGANVARINGVAGGNSTITITADDNKGGKATTSFNVVVNPPPDPNDPPAVTPITDQTVTVGESITVPVTVTDADGDTVSISAVVDPVSQATVTLSATNSLVITGAQEGTATVTVTASDGTESVEETFELTVEPSPNELPTIGAINPQTCVAGDTLSVDFTADDPDGGDLTVTPASSGAAATVSLADDDTLEINCVQAGTANINVVVEDDEGGTTNTAFTVTVSAANEPPTLNTIANLDCTVNEAPTVAISYDDPDGDILTVSPSSDDAAIATVNLLDDTTLQVNCLDEGSASITVSIDDGKGGTASLSFSVNVTPGNAPPVLTDFAPVACEAGDTTTVSVTYNDPDGDTVTISASADNGNASVNASDTSLEISCDSPGDTNITVQADDGNGGTDSASFVVTVNQANQVPVLDAVSDVTCAVGETPSTALNYNDPDGDTVTASASSDNGAVSASVQPDGVTVQLSCNSEGNATVTVSIDDGRGGTASESFGVSVSSPNNSPSLDGISDVTCEVGQTPSVTLVYNDLDGDPVTASASSDNGAVSAAVQPDGVTIQLNCNSEGNAVVNVTVDDGNGGNAAQSFNVSVGAANQQPALNGISDVTCAVGETPSVTLSYSDPDSDPVTASASSDNGAVSANLQPDGVTLQLSCNSEGAAFVSVGVDDGNGGTASQSFSVTVEAGNNPPDIQDLAPVTCAVGETPTVSLSYSDPDADAVTVSTTSETGLVVVNPLDAFTLQLSCSTEGTDNITVTVDDGSGGTDSTTFPVTVTGGGSTFNILDYPELPDIDQNVSDRIDQIRGTGLTSPDTFTVVGDDLAADPNFLTNFGTPGSYQLGNNGSLQSIIDTYTATGSFTAPRYAAGNGWGIDTLYQPSGDGACDTANGETALACDLRNNAPAITLVMFIPNNATALSSGDFRSYLQQVVNDAMNSGSVPVLVTLPNDGSIDPATLDEYNQVIVEVATNANVPLWNLYITMQNAPNGVYSTGGTDAFDLTDPALGFGANRRNLVALQVLERIRGEF
jgi:hypothetical protein